MVWAIAGLGVWLVTKTTPMFLDPENNLWQGPMPPVPSDDNLIELDTLIGDFSVTKAVGWFILGFALLKYGR